MADAAVAGEVARKPASMAVFALILTPVFLFLFSAMWPCSSWQSLSADNVFRGKGLRMNLYFIDQEVGYIYSLNRCH
jgi:hypothetical protein